MKTSLPYFRLHSSIRIKSSKHTQSHSMISYYNVPHKQRRRRRSQLIEVVLVQLLHNELHFKGTCHIWTWVLRDLILLPHPWWVSPQSRPDSAQTGQLKTPPWWSHTHSASGCQGAIQGPQCSDKWTCTQEWRHTLMGSATPAAARSHWLPLLCGVELKETCKYKYVCYFLFLYKVRHTFMYFHSLSLSLTRSQSQRSHWWQPGAAASIVHNSRIRADPIDWS